MPWRNDQLQGTSRKKYKSVITAELKNTWPEITES